MNKNLFSTFYQPSELSDEEMDILAQKHRYQELPKGTILLKRGDVSNENYIIEAGVVRAYTFDSDNNEITTRLFFENELAIETLSFFGRMPSPEFLETVTDCKIWSFHWDTVQELYHSMPAFREWGRYWMTRELFLSETRMLDFKTLSAEQRYRKLIAEKPKSVYDIPLKYIASFLGIADATLSRIRKK
ncbi:Crp/Fnr family transcriptional regulator [Capnocytophaga sp.]|uniref:Crp/Fnr family transcriptional regulator n=1 Tax=Capnocytophaga sp. TaxID=44737 RepID=UPI0026DC9568|nr:Crp/Fnr family transcriptional regulator [Capnocytophaga sp.]MDO5105170.1 Crp/Fnr family transcriptional regulator [Capnocytophaga sp.]